MLLWEFDLKAFPGQHQDKCSGLWSSCDVEEIKASQNIDIKDIILKRKKLLLKISRVKSASLPQTIKNNWLLIWEDDRIARSP